MIYPFFDDKITQKILTSSTSHFVDVILKSACINDDKPKELKISYEVVFRRVVITDHPDKAEITKVSIPSEYALQVAEFIMQADGALKKRVAEEIRKCCPDCGLSLGLHKNDCEYYVKRETVYTRPNSKKGEQHERHSDADERP